MIHRYTGFGLVLLLVLTSQAMAVARGAPSPRGQIELCTGTGPVMVYVDDDGAPVGAPHICPDYALNLLAFVAPPDCAPQSVRPVPRRVRALPDARCSAQLRFGRLARGPPRPV